MKLLNVSRTYRNLMRIKQMLQVLTKHGFGHIVSQLNLTSHIPSLRQVRILSQLPAYLSEDSTAVRARLVLQELGPTFVKLGQILSSRPDILSKSFLQEFKLLQDRVASFPVEQVHEIIEREFHAERQQIFTYFEEEPLASGSIGQVHCAMLPGGQEVIVKVKRPGIEKIIVTDLAILHFFAELAEKYIEEMRFFQPVMVVDEFARTIQRELDFTAEAAYSQKFCSLLEQDPHVHSPRVYWKYTTPNVITLEKLSGINIGQKELLQARGIDLKILAQNFISSFMQQYFVWGLFHADPHPGNILVGKNGQLYLIDFGMVGHFSEELKNQLSTVVLALVKNDLDTIIEVYADIGVFSGDINRRELKTEVLELLDKYFNTPFQHLDLSKVFQDIVQTGRNHKVIFPRDFILLGKSLVMAVSIAQELDPDFDLARSATPHFTAILKEKFSPKRLFSLGSFQLWSLFSLVQKLPSEIKEILHRLKTGNLRIVLKMEALEKHVHQLQKIANRLSVSIILSAIIIASTLLIKSQVGPQFQNVPIFGLIGYAMAGLIGLWLFVGILRSGSL